MRRRMRQSVPGAGGWNLAVSGTRVRQERRRVSPRSAQTVLDRAESGARRGRVRSRPTTRKRRLGASGHRGACRPGDDRRRYVRRRSTRRRRGDCRGRCRRERPETAVRRSRALVCNPRRPRVSQQRVGDSEVRRRERLPMPVRGALRSRPHGQNTTAVTRGVVARSYRRTKSRPVPSPHRRARAVRPVPTHSATVCGA